jgi:hypothetical protein
MAQYRVYATLELTVDVEYLIDDDDVVVEGPDAPAPTDAQLMQVAEERASEILDDLDVLTGVDQNHISEATCTITNIVKAQG